MQSRSVRNHGQSEPTEWRWVLASSSGIFTKLPLALRQSLEKGECVLFVGAGIGSHYKRSDGTAVPDAKQLATDLIKHFKLNIDPSTDLVRVAQLVEIRASRDELVTLSSRRRLQILNQMNTSNGSRHLDGDRSLLRTMTWD
jgi:hypothetical protein